MHAAALPSGAEDPSDRRFEPFMGVGDHQFDVLVSRDASGFQKLDQSLAGSGVMRADDFGWPRFCPRTYCRDRHDRSPSRSLVCRVEPRIVHSAATAGREGMDALFNFIAQLRNLRLADPRQPHRLHQIVDQPGRHAANPGLLDHRDQRLLRAHAGFQKRREVAALPQLRDAQLQRPSRVSRRPREPLRQLVRSNCDLPRGQSSRRRRYIGIAGPPEQRRSKPRSPAFSSKSASTNLSSVIGSSRTLQVEVWQLTANSPAAFRYPRCGA